MCTICVHSQIDLLVVFKFHYPVLEEDPQTGEVEVSAEQYQ